MTSGGRHGRAVSDNAFHGWLLSDHPDAKAERDPRRAATYQAQTGRAAAVGAWADKIGAQPDAPQTLRDLAASIGPQADQSAARAQARYAEPDDAYVTRQGAQHETHMRGYTEFGRIANPVLFALDEVTQTAAVPLADWLATSAGSGIQVCFIVHTPAQLRVRYGADDAKAIWVLAGTKIVLGGNTDAEMAEEISKLAGNYGGEMALPVVPVAYIRQLPESRALVLAMNRSPIAVKVCPVWRRAAFRLRINSPAYQPLPQPVALPQIRPGAEGQAA
jgi:TraM recognition site of TraD and TraG